MVFFRSIGESESENMHLARLWREGSPERQLVALSAESRRSGLLLKNTRDSPSPFKRITKKYIFLLYQTLHFPEQFLRPFHHRHRLFWFFPPRPIDEVWAGFYFEL